VSAGGVTPREPDPDATWAAVRRRAAEVTPARLFLGSAGLSPRTADALGLRADHAFARDAVDARMDLADGPLARLDLFEVATRAADHATYLRRPDLGRRLSDEGRARLGDEGAHGADVQVVVGDGLSATAVHVQVPDLLPRLRELADARGWRWGRPFAVRHCRVGILNEVGEVLTPRLVILLIGERPGLGSAESLSAYLAWRPRSGSTDADRNLVSNIHDRGTPVVAAAPRIMRYGDAIRAAGRSGVAVKEPDGSG
jgi:ethanolamine ammonia-lyase small subunit